MTTASDRSAVDWKKLDKNHYLHPFTDFKSLGKKKSRIITRGDGVYIYAVSYTHLTLPTILLV